MMPAAAVAAARRPPSRRSLRRTVEAAAAGDERAWSALVGQFGGMVRHVARSYRLDDADVDDVAQETWLRLMRHVHALDDPAAVPGWLITTTRREALRALQRRVREVPLDAVGDVDEPDPADPTEGIEAEERRAALLGAVARLPAHQRRLVGALLDHEGAGYAALAARLGAPVGSLGPTRARAIERLRRDVRLARTCTPA
jgi:RNA polymerase sigma factor (sigma-70 family)